MRLVAVGFLLTLVVSRYRDRALCHLQVRNLELSIQVTFGLGYKTVLAGEK